MNMNETDVITSRSVLVGMIGLCMTSDRGHRMIDVFNAS
jgi:hypothetical protein